MPWRRFRLWLLAGVVVSAALCQGGTVDVCDTHPKIDALLCVGCGRNYNYPSDHPNIHDTLKAAAGADFPSDHPNIDDVLRAGGDYDEDDHPAVEPYLRFIHANPPCTWPQPGTCVQNASSAHPNVDEWLKAGHVLHGMHTSQHAIWSQYLPVGHPNVDTIFSQGTPMPSDHISIDQYICRNSSLTTGGYPEYGSPLVTITATHPNIDTACTENSGGVPSWHPNVNKYYTTYLPAGHPDIDSWLSTDPASRNPMPSGHVSIQATVTEGEEVQPPAAPFGEWVCGERWSTVGYWHPGIDDALKNGEGLPSTHPDVMDMIGGALPNGHPDVNTLFRDGYSLPSSHPPVHVRPYVCTRPIWSPGAILGLMIGMVLFLAAAVRWMYKMTKLAPCRMAINVILDTVQNQVSPSERSQNRRTSKPVPSTDRDVEGGGPAPHIEMQIQGAEGTEHPIGMGEVSLEMAPVPLAPEKRTLEGFKFDSLRSGVTEGHAQISKAPVHLRDGLPMPDLNLMNYRSRQLHLRHRADVMGYEEDPLPDGAAIPAPEGWILPEHAPADVHDPLNDLETHVSGKARLLRLRPKRNTIYHRVKRVIITCRIPKTKLMLSTVLLVFLYLFLNLLALTSSGYSWERGWGSLAAANTMLLIIPATRNSILTWFLGLPFDHVVVYHRIIGRIMIFCATIHGLFYSYKFVINVAERPYPYLTGLAAYLFSLVILMTTFDRIRRRCFQIFYWSHFSFIFMFVMAVIHVPEAEPLLGIGLGLYGLDRILRIVWTLFPRKTTLFHAKGNIAQVRFPKNPITAAIGMHRLGQYYFVNFPRVSLTQWHPFSVSSGPREKDVEIHIRALGKHTKKIVEMAKKKEENAEKHNKKAWTWIRVEGPYGVHDFNCRRYPVVFLVGGGVGITPVVGILKDIYGVGNLTQKKKDKVIPHCIEAVHAMWIMPKKADFDCFSTEFQECLERSRSAAHLPRLVLHIHCTREKGELPFPLTAGRPNFTTVFDQIQENHDNHATLVFACGPSVVVHQIWDQCTKRAATRSARFDFHHEVFEF